MNRKIIFVTFLTIVVAGTAAYLISVKKSTPYATKEECEKVTGKECHLFKGLCQVGEAHSQEEMEENEKFSKECLSKIDTWQPIEATPKSNGAGEM
jgi:hypothetical protein